MTREEAWKQAWDMAEEIEYVDPVTDRPLSPAAQLAHRTVDAIWFQMQLQGRVVNGQLVPAKEQA